MHISNRLAHKKAWKISANIRKTTQAKIEKGRPPVSRFPQGFGTCVYSSAKSVFIVWQAPPSSSMLLYSRVGASYCIQGWGKSSHCFSIARSFCFKLWNSRRSFEFLSTVFFLPTLDRGVALSFPLRACLRSSFPFGLFFVLRNFLFGMDNIHCWTSQPDARMTFAIERRVGISWEGKEID